MIRRLTRFAPQLQEQHAQFLDSPRADLWLVGSTMSAMVVEPSESDWSYKRRVSIDGERVVGYFSADIDRETHGVRNLAAINYEPGSLTFAWDLNRFVRGLILEFEVVRWSCVRDSVNDHLYGRAVEKFGGHRAGYAQRYYRLQNGRLVDAAFFEVLGKGGRE